MVTHEYRNGAGPTHLGEALPEVRQAHEVSGRTSSASFRIKRGRRWTAFSARRSRMFSRSTWRSGNDSALPQSRTEPSCVPSDCRLQATIGGVRCTLQTGLAVKSGDDLQGNRYAVGRYRCVEGPIPAIRDRRGIVCAIRARGEDRALGAAPQRRARAGGWREEPAVSRHGVRRGNAA